jgi:hypothetical protein
MSSIADTDRSDIGRTGDAATNTTAFLDAGADALPQVVQRASAWAEAAACYLRERRAGGIAADVGRLARERPGQTLVAAALWGVLVGGALYGLGR